MGERYTGPLAVGMTGKWGGHTDVKLVKIEGSEGMVGYGYKPEGDGTMRSISEIRASFKPDRPGDDDRDVWRGFRPMSVLENTGEKDFKPGEVWACRPPGELGTVRRILSITGNFAEYVDVISGETRQMETHSPAAKFAVLLFAAPAMNDNVGRDGAKVPWKPGQIRLGVIVDSPEVPTDGLGCGPVRFRVLQISSRASGRWNVEVMEGRYNGSSFHAWERFPNRLIEDAKITCAGEGCEAQIEPTSKLCRTCELKLIT